MNKRFLLLLAAVVGATGVTYGLFPTDRGLADPPAFNAAVSDFTPESIAGFDKFAVYSVGDAFEGIPMRAMLRRDETHEVAGLQVKKDYVSVIYGECVARGLQGCAPPLEIQTWPACARSLADYTLTPNGEPLPNRPFKLRGVPGAMFEEGGRVELYTGNVTIVVFGNDAGQIWRAANAVRLANPQTPVGAAAAVVGLNRDLPAPVAGALQGTLQC
jgi:hypothetical protein